MNSASQRNNDYLPDIPPNMAEKDQIKFLHKHIAQLWKKQIDDRNTIEKLLSLVNSEISTKRIIEIINGLNTHTGEMPDRKGENRDHDARYLTKKEFEIYKASV